MKDKEMRDAFNIPTQTLHQWKNSIKDDWRMRLYLFMEMHNADEIRPYIERIEKILKLKEEGKK